MLKFKHLTSADLFAKLKFSANKSNTSYFLGDSTVVNDGTPDVMYDDVVFIKSKDMIYTHGHFYGNKNNVFTKGMIMMWSGSVNSIPSGWALCNGQNGTPNLVNRFILGASSSGSYTSKTAPLGNVVSNPKTLSKGNLPSHKHDVSVLSGGSHQHTYYDTKPASKQTHENGKWSNFNHFTNTTSSSTYTGTSGSHTHTISEKSVGSGTSFTVTTQIPYYALAFIIKL